ncbi:ATP synthase subunit I [Paenibacillus sp. NPDC058071]|uniref:ATP synthase subunit I n=1 Tax=Paenibacillus sp. NPDC058071 TaxID=3346326 RepID=UPI0036DB63D3
MDRIMSLAVRIMLVMAAASLVLWALLPTWRPVMLGLVVGFAASALNAFFLQRRVGMLAQAATEEGAKRRGLGFGSRIATVLMVAMFAYRYPEILNMPAALIGSMVMPFVILVSGIIHNVKEDNSGKG